MESTFDSPISMKIFKGVTSACIIKEFPELEKQLWHGILSSTYYYVGTAGHVSFKVIEKYILEQERHSTIG